MIVINITIQPCWCNPTENKLVTGQVGPERSGPEKAIRPSVPWSHLIQYAARNNYSWQGTQPTFQGTYVSLRAFGLCKFS